MTSTSVGWAILDGQGGDAITLDHDAFDVQSGAGLGDMSQHAAAARGAHAIATTSGHTVGSVRVTWSQDVEASATALLKSLADLAFDNVLAIPLSQATRTWAIEVGRANQHHKTALCILEPGTATVMVVATGAGSVRTAVTNTRERAADLVDWLTTIFNREGWLPECLYLVGSHDDLDAVTAPISDGLPIPVFDSFDSQLALARGAALATVCQVTAVSSPVAETPRKLKLRTDRSRLLSDVKKVTTSAAETPRKVEPRSDRLSDVKVTTSAAETPRKVEPRTDRSRLLSDVKKVTTTAAAVAVVGAALSLASGSALNGAKVSTQAANPLAAGAPVTSASVYTVPAPVSAPPVPRVQALAAEPPPAPAAPPETLTLPAEPLAAAEPEPVSVPVPRHTASASPPANVSAAPLAAPPAPIAAPSAVPLAAPPAVLPAAAAAPIAPPPAAPLAAPPAPIAAPPPAAPAGAPDPAVPPPPPDPIQVLLSPLFGGLP
jgi:hypothetical protein